MKHMHSFSCGGLLAAAGRTEGVAKLPRANDASLAESTTALIQKTVLFSMS
jgi:hypothetical protein